jgi:DNA-directed RNA polymerase subunit RPC12/RpoP
VGQDVSGKPTVKEGLIMKWLVLILALMLAGCSKPKPPDNCAECGYNFKTSKEFIYATDAFPPHDKGIRCPKCGWESPKIPKEQADW